VERVRVNRNGLKAVDIGKGINFKAVIKKAICVCGG